MLVLSILTTLLSTVAFAQRPEGENICDYYAAQRYGSASKDNQFQLIQGIVALAFAGSSSLPKGNVSEKITGILHPGVQDGVPVDLEGWFNGSKATTNLNNQPSTINWLDDGEAQPLLDFLSGETDNVMLSNTTNQFRLFGHFFIAFSRIFECSDPPKPIASSNGPVSLAYAHKFMNLNETHLSYFIDQITLAAEHYGFSPQDANSLNALMNQRYNVRCAPAVTLNPQRPPQLLSLCQDPTCPLALNPDCPAYVNLTAEGTSGDSETQAPSPVPSTSLAPVDLPTETPAPSPTPEPAKDEKESLSPGAIAGVAVGGFAVLAFLIAAILWYKKRHHSSSTPTVGPYPAPQSSVWDNENKSPVFTYGAPSESGYGSPPPQSPGFGGSNYGSMAGHQSEMSYQGWHAPQMQQQPLQEMESPAQVRSPVEMGEGVPSRGASPVAR